MCEIALNVGVSTDCAPQRTPEAIMKSIKQKMLLSFCLTALVSITIVGLVVFRKIDDSISQQSEQLATDMTARMYETLNLPHQTFELLIREDVRRSVNDLRTSSTLIENLESEHFEALEVEQYLIALRDGLDFVMLFNFEGQLEASFPPQLNDNEVEKYFKSWEFGAYVLSMVEDGTTVAELDLWDALSKHDSHILQVFRLGKRDISGKGALSIVSAGVVKNDFDEALGICLVGKFLNNYDKPLKLLHDIADYASVIYLDSTPVAQAGFDAIEQDGFDLSTLQIKNSDIQSNVYKSAMRSDQVLTLAGKPYLSACSALKSFTNESIGMLCVGLPELHITQAQQTIVSYGVQTKKSIQTWFVGIGIISLGFFVLVSLMIATKIVNPIKQLSEIARRIAAGDFHQEVPVASQDEIGDLSMSLREVVHSFQEISTTSEAIAIGNLNHDISPRSEQDILGHALQHMSIYLNKMASVAEAVAEGDLTRRIHVRSPGDMLGRAIKSMTEGLCALIAQIRSSTEQIASTGTTVAVLAANDTDLVQNVNDSMKHVVSTMNEMGGSVENVASNMESLSSSVEETSASISQMASTVTNITSNATNLHNQTQQTGTSLDDALRSLEEVVENTDVSQQLAQGTIQNALEGQQAVEEVATSMETIQQTIITAVEAMTRFEQRSRDIDTVLEVIREITEQTSLLALNASIIAAQAGTHGRGFAIVADEIKNLADGVRNSTKDIASIVTMLQRETQQVVQTIYTGAENVKQGMEHTRQARDTLQKILSSIQQSSAMVTEITGALHGLMTSSRKVSLAMDQVNRMTNEITLATNEHQVSTRQIQQAIGHINDTTSQIQHATSQQSTGIHQVLEAAHDVTILIDQSLKSCQQISQTTEIFSSQADLLWQSVDRFKLTET